MEVHGGLAHREHHVGRGFRADAAAPFQAGRVIDELFVELTVDQQHRAGLGGPLRRLAIGLERGAGAHRGMAVRIHREHAVRQQREIARGGVAVRQVQRHHGLAVFHVQAERRELVVVDARIGGKQQPPAALLAPLAQRIDTAEWLAAGGFAPVQGQLLVFQVHVHDAVVLAFERQFAAVQRPCGRRAAGHADEQQQGQQQVRQHAPWLSCRKGLG